MARDAVKIPPYPGVAMKLQQLVSAGNYGATDIVKVVSADQVLAASLLRCANSPSYRGATQITALPEAVARLGSAEVVKVALAASFGAESSRQGALAELRRRSWQDSLASAFISFQLAHARKMNPQEAFVCGLLHDFGRVVAVATIEAILAHNQDARSLPAEEWLGIVDHFHVELGLMVAARWKLSEILQTVISSHHDLARAGVHRPMVEVVAAADAVVAVLGSRPDVTLVDLASVPQISKAEMSVILAAIPKLAPFLASLDEAAPASPATVEVTSQVDKPPTMLKAPTRDLDMPVTVVRSGRDTKGRCTRLAYEGLGFKLAEKLAVSYLARLRLEPAGAGPFDVHAQILKVTPADGGAGFTIEAKLFALDGDAKERWRKLVAGLGGAAANAG
jgi:HD-like signal output (HDOD) protein